MEIPGQISAEIDKFDPDRRLYGRDWPKSAMTMIGSARMRNVRRLIETVLAEGVAGDLLEAGVWRGGAAVSTCAES
jgi:Macrocin-O-methyltransferase (TylF)